MTKFSATKFAMAAAVLLCCGAGAHAADRGEQGELARVVDETIRPLMKEHGVPGMAIAVTVRGKKYIFNYGLASRESGQKVTDETMFEIGSIARPSRRRSHPMPQRVGIWPCPILPANICPRSPGPVSTTSAFSISGPIPPADCHCSFPIPLPTRRA